MQGDRYGAVVNVGKKYVHVFMDTSNRVLKLAPTSLEPLGENPWKTGNAA